LISTDRKNDMNKLGVIASTLAALIGVTSISYADGGTRSPGVNARQHQQRDRVQQGVRSGELTRRETRGLAREQQDIRQLERAYKSDGTLSGAERRDLHQEQNQASRDIYQQKHDAQDRPAVPVAVRDPLVNERQGNQAARVAGGVKSGELTHDEAQALRTERRDIRELEHTYKSDGALTKEERADLHQELNEQSRDIYEEKHDDDTRP
jgi:hypothetical protein